MALPLTGVSVLVVEDDFFVATDIKQTLEDAGADVVGPAASVTEAMHLIDDDGFSVALLDYQLGKENSSSIADRLDHECVSYFFHSGSREEVARDYPDAMIVSKPSQPEQLVAAIDEIHRVKFPA
jgi:DNA-binding NarL/FixJ family response regulator